MSFDNQENQMDNAPDQRVSENDMSDWFDIGAKCKESFPLLHEKWNEICSKADFLPDDHPLGQLRCILRSAKLLGQHAIYSSMCVDRYTKIEASNTCEDYVSYYIHNFVGRVMSSTDVFGLLINHIYELGLDEWKCSLPRGPIPGCLDNKGMNRSLSVLIQRARDQWLIPFYDMRNLVVHRSGLKFVIGGIDSKSFINIQLGEMLRVRSEREVIERFLSGINILVPNTCILDPVILCGNLWDKWRNLANNIMSSINGAVSEFIRRNKVLNKDQTSYDIL